MDRRRRFVVVTAAGAAAALLLFARPGSDPDGPPDLDQPDVGDIGVSAPGRPADVPDLGGTEASPGGASPAPAIEDGGVAGPEGLPAAERPGVVAVAERFAATWAIPDPGWHARLAGLATPALAAELAGTDPPQPAPELTGPGRIYLDAPRWARVGVPAVRGTVVLDVVAAADGDWLVAAVDWRPA